MDTNQSKYVACQTYMYLNSPQQFYFSPTLKEYHGIDWMRYRLVCILQREIRRQFNLIFSGARQEIKLSIYATSRVQSRIRQIYCSDVENFDHILQLKVGSCIIVLSNSVYAENCFYLFLQNFENVIGRFPEALFEGTYIGCLPSTNLLFGFLLS